MKALFRFLAPCALGLAYVLASLPVSAQTVLLVVRENANSRPLPPPLAVREGVSGSLFDAGIIVLDAPGAAPLPGTPELARLARAAGAQVVLQCSTEYADTTLGADLVRISARTTYALIDSSNGAVIAEGTQEATNKDREHDVGRAALGGEIGKAVVLQVRKVLDRF
jgi:hypothetical protein